MIISDLDYLDSMPATSAMHLNGSGILATFDFEAFASGSSTYIYSDLNNYAISDSKGLSAGSSVTVTSIAEGNNAFARLFASSTASVS